VSLAAAAVAWALSLYGAVYVGGGSMSPTLLRGDLVVVRKGAGGVRERDVVLVEKPGWPGGVLHRVVEEMLDDRLVLQGDANPVPDLEPTPVSAVRGVVTFVIPTGRVLAVVEALARMVQSRVT
jgi:signal peptidase I